MPFEDARSHLADILDSIVLIEQFVRGMDLDAYRDSSKTRAAVERSKKSCHKPTYCWRSAAR
jgi:uncharacterized protein with HEPN domain